MSVHGLLPNSAVVGTAKRMNRKPRRKDSVEESGILAVLTALFAIFM